MFTSHGPLNSEAKPVISLPSIGLLVQSTGETDLEDEHLNYS